MRLLPSVDYAPTARAGYWLLGAAALLWIADLALFMYADSHQAYIGSVTREKITQPNPGEYVRKAVKYNLSWFPAWEDPGRLAIPLLGLGILGLALSLTEGGLSPFDVGLTLGKPRITLYWFIVTTIIYLIGYLLLLGLAILAIRWSRWSVPAELFEPTVSYRVQDLWLDVVHGVVMAPLIEEPLYRAIPARFLEAPGGRWLASLFPGDYRKRHPALEQHCGRWLAILGCAVIWTTLHWIYGHPLWYMPMYFVGAIIATWIYLKCRSLLVPIWLHALFNFTAVTIPDWLRLKYPDLLPRLLNVNL